MAQLLTLGGVTIKKPSDFQVEKYRLTKSGRTADGKMHMDSIARKRKFLLKYNVLKGTELDIILAIIDNDTNVFYVLNYIENDVAKSATVYSGAIKTTQFRTDTGAWYWKDVAFDLIEQ